MHMNYEEEIGYRNKILSRIHRGEEISSEDRLWLLTHRVINQALGYPYLNTDIIHLHPNVNYAIRIRVENLRYPGRIIPVITVPGGKGEIIANTPVTDYKGNVSMNKAVKMLGVLVDLNHNETEVSYQSSLGLLEVSFQCDYYDDKQRIMKRESSHTGNPIFAMLREVLTDNKILYWCKAPVDDSFESFVFSIEWVQKT